jgi:hypothetical protein
MQQRQANSGIEGIPARPTRPDGDQFPCLSEGNVIMNRTTVSILALSVAALSAGQALAAEPAGKTRAQVQAELADAVRNGDIVTDNEAYAGKKLNEVFPDNYSAKAQAAGKTRAQVQAELAEAIRTGDVRVGADHRGSKLNEIYPDRYPAKAQVAGKSRGEVKAELTEAVRTGYIVTDNEAFAGKKLNEVFPGQYPRKS